MKNIFFLIGLSLILFTSCKSNNLYKIEGRQIAITDSLKTNQSIEDYIKPYRIQINKSLDSVISYAKDTYSKKDGFLNTAIGNMMADAVYEQSNPIFKARTGHTIDLVLLNHGGIRSIISKGNITTRTAYNVMPFENSVVVVTMKGNKVKELVDYLVRDQRPHPIYGLQIVLNEDLQLKSATINGKNIEDNKSYYVATNDYLYSGGDKMIFFKPNEHLDDLNYKIRNVLIDYFTKKDTIAPVIDDRFIQIKH
ncbi:5'-nucleotidase C-terminal domain-containing protein [Psychroserpens ponticola]|uniref:5'-nucleotidase n=1 Tax=Psychroserpens ponticola TaxID=2932268 RepID=A0ABY7RTU5_9FLAO|nr:5'-nucleotidase [Psychroserpens ponticola]WCO00519.1 5'-nucleotidase [Psychroserpens ponticola]